MSRQPIAFYAPLKAPDHPHPSGDRTMARLLLRALDRAGFAPAVASGLRTWEPAGDPARQNAIRAASLAEADRLTASYEALPADRRPRAWFTYHCYYKAPDHLGPEMARRLGIPYAIAEASRAPKRAHGTHAAGHAAAERAIDRADILFVMTRHDRACLERAARPGQALVNLPPFIDTDAFAIAPGPTGEGRPPRLLAVAMMRDGDKLASFRLLGEALARIPNRPWVIDVVGDGPARPEVERILAPFGARVAFRGRLEGADLAVAYNEADLLVWPAVNEAYGMVLLEAQANGCPVVAGCFGGVPDVVVDGATGLLAEPGNAAALAEGVASLLADPARRATMGEAARRFVREERSLDRAARILGDALHPLIGTEAAS
ncbi:glycosyltransferase family 4 protein [Enterovirga sp. CN4-39]|uniref:glycosyltransferase family 4 protein n=1 Tax=Enterovirga sp. CN4-39 TaxID=3400910 RepID=UPI003C10D791